MRNIFISYSGNLSKKIAQCLDELIQNIFIDVDIFRAENMRKGDHWKSKILSELEKTNIVIICLTPENLNSRWIIFEYAAALIGKKRVMPVLFQVSPEDVKPPLDFPQFTLMEREEVRRLIDSINLELMSDAKPEDFIDERFNRYWKLVEKHMDEIKGLKDITPYDREYPAKVIGYEQLLRTYLNYINEWTNLIIISRTPVIFFEHERESSGAKRQWYNGLLKRINNIKKYHTTLYTSKWHLIKYLDNIDEGQRRKILDEWYWRYTDAKDSLSIYVVPPEYFPSTSMIYAEDMYNRYIMIQLREGIYRIDESKNLFYIEDTENVEKEFWISHKEPKDISCLSDWDLCVKEFIEGNPEYKDSLISHSISFKRFLTEMHKKYGFSDKI